MRKWLIRGVLWVAVLECIYLGVVNLALNLPYTQKRINQLRPDKFAVSWDNAWSWYPFRIRARGISANGQSSSQQWQVETPAVFASISVLPLLKRSVDIHRGAVQDIVYHQRPRLRPDKKNAALRKYFPDIKGRKIDDKPAGKAPKKKGKPWTINLTDIHARGNHRIWINQIQGDLQGEIQTDFVFQTLGGPLSLNNGRVDLNIASLVIDGNREVARRGHVKGPVELSPFVPSENKGIKALAFLKAAVEIRTETESLAFLNHYLSGFHGMKVDGAGKLNGRIEVENGILQPATNLAVSAHKLKMDLLSHRTMGAGKITLNITPEKPDTINLNIGFGTLQVFHSEREDLLLSGEGLSVTGRRGTALFPTDSEVPQAVYLAVSIPSLKVPNLKSYQRYLPARWDLKLNGGQGALQGKAEMSNTGFSTYMKLISEDADVGLKNYRFNADLEMAIKTDCPSIGSSGIDIAGTYIRLNEAKLSRRQQEKSAPWHASLSVEKGMVKLNLSDEIPKDPDVKQLWDSLQGKDVATLLNTGDREIKLKGEISDLRWLNLILKNPYNMAVHGAGEVTANVNIASGWLAPGTILEIHPQELKVNILEYLAKGDGRVTLEVEKGGQHPDLDLNVKVNNARFMRRDEEEAFIENVAIQLHALGREMSYDGPGGDMALELRIPSATVKDMSVYNRYLPKQSPFAFSGGKADLTADIDLKPTSAAGFVKLKTKGMRCRIDEQNVSGELTADIQLAGGVPQKMNFDISGSSIVLDRVRVLGKQENFDQSDWYVRFDLEKGRAVWKKPTHIDIEAGLEMKDTRPMVAILSNQRGKYGWIEKILTVENVKGEAKMSVAQENIVIPHAFIRSDNIDVGAKGVINARTRDGVFYIRFKKLHGLLKVRDGDRNFDILNAREKFDEYSTSHVKLD